MKENTLEDPILGRLVYREELEWWEGQVEIRPSLRIDFRLSTWTGTRPKLSLAELVHRGIEYLEWARRSEPSIRQRITDELLATYNEDWNNENEGMGQVTRDEFLARIGPTSITLDTDGDSTCGTTSVATCSPVT